MSEFIAMGDGLLFFWSRDRLRKVTPEDVFRVASVYLKPSNRRSGSFSRRRSQGVILVAASR